MAEYSKVKDVHDKYESIVTSLRAQFLKFNDERERREKTIRKEAQEIGNSDLQLSSFIMNYLEWDTNSLLVEEQTIGIYEQYLKDLYASLRDLRDQKEKISEMTEELDRLNEDLELMGDLVRKRDNDLKKKDEDIGRILKEKEKLLEAIRKLRSQPIPNISSVGTNNFPEEEEDSEKEIIYRELVNPTARAKSVGKKTCESCGKDISNRKSNAKYCVECYYVNHRKAIMAYKERKKPKTKDYDSRGDVQQPKEEEDAEELNEGEEYQETGIVEPEESGEQEEDDSLGN